jgi:hypothetical protein
MEGDIIMDMMSYLMGKKSGGAKGLQVEVVTELPEIGEADILYLVPKEDTGDNDIFDEYLWVDNDWEHIGSTDIDLSNYYTKSETDDLVASIPQTTYEVYTTEQVYLYNSSMAAYIHSADAKKSMSDAITNAFKQGLHSFTVLFGNYTQGAISKAYMQNNDLQSKPTTINFRGFDAKISWYQQSSNRYLTPLWIVAGGTWSGEEFTVSSFYYYSNSFDVLTLDNTRLYTPTTDYHPATKKYVDDAISSAITDALGGNY